MNLSRFLFTALASAAILATPTLHAETTELKLGYGLGVSFLPMFVPQP